MNITRMKDKAGKTDDQRGLRCRQCGHGRLRVIYTRHARGGKVIRRRECRECGARMTTWEKAVGVASQ